MKRIIKIILIVGVLICSILGIPYYAFLQIDFIGHKDPKTIEENVKRWNNMLLSAEYRNGTDYCKVELMDSTNIEISVGDKSGGTMLTETYKIINDTITVSKGIEHAKKYLNCNKFLIHNNKLLYKLNPNGGYDTTTTMSIKFNKLKG